MTDYADLRRRLRQRRDDLAVELEHADTRQTPLWVEGCRAELDEAAAAIETLVRENAKLQTALRVQANAVRVVDQKERAEYVATATLDSEREMNAKLTTQLEQAESALAACQRERDDLAIMIDANADRFQHTIDTLERERDQARAHNAVLRQRLADQNKAYVARLADLAAKVDHSQRESVARDHRLGAEWTPFERSYLKPEEAARAKELGVEDDLILLNSRYQVNIRMMHSPEWGQMAHLSIKTLDKSTRHDWRDFQRIKNEICGEESEAVELYPRESRLVDTSNQYHLWVFKDFKFPFGFNERLLVDGDWQNSKQEPWPEGERPKDCLDTPQFDKVLELTKELQATKVKLAEMIENRDLFERANAAAWKALGDDVEMPEEATVADAIVALRVAHNAAVDDLRVNARLLARQGDLARGAENERDAMRRENERIVSEMKQAIAVNDGYVTEHLALRKERSEFKTNFYRSQRDLAQHQAWLAECYRLTGADPDGNEDWRLAPKAVAEVARLRKERDVQDR